MADPRRTPSGSTKILITGSSGLIGSELVGCFDSRAEGIDGVDDNMRADFFWSIARSLEDMVTEIADAWRVRLRG